MNAPEPTTLREIRTALEDLASPAKAAHLQRYFKTGPGEYGEGDIFRGIRVPQLRKLATRFKALPLSDAARLLQSRFHEDRLLALLILVKHFERSEAAVCRDIYELYLNNTAYINNWDLVDSSAPNIVGAFLKNRSRRPLRRLAQSESLWERRIAMLATYHFIRLGDFKDALDIAERLLQDSEDLIHKAVGWMLREIGNRDRAVEEAFLRRFYKTMPRTMLRYAIERFPEETRRAYLDGTI